MTRPSRLDTRGAGLRPAPFPALALGLSALVFGLAWVPGAREALIFERSALAAGEWWRLFTGHAIHWSTDHLLWDVGTFAILGAACELRSRRRFAACLMGSTLAISLAVWGLLPQLARYGGLSGIDCALFVLLASELWLERRRFDTRVAGVLAIGLGGALTLKVGFEWLTGGTVFVADLGANIVPVPMAHLVGAAVGLAIPAVAALTPRLAEA